MWRMYFIDHEFGFLPKYMANLSYGKERNILLSAIVKILFLSKETFQSFSLQSLFCKGFETCQRTHQVPTH